MADTCLTSWANNLVAGDTNGAEDVFIHDLCPNGNCGRPAKSGTLSLQYNPSYYSGQSVALSAQIRNPTYAPLTYSIDVNLESSNGSVLDTVAKTVTVPAAQTINVGNISFGSRPAGTYRISAALRIGSEIVSTFDPVTIFVTFSAGQQTAFYAADILQQTANSELDQIRDLVAKKSGNQHSENYRSTAMRESRGRLCRGQNNRSDLFRKLRDNHNWRRHRRKRVHGGC